MSDQLTVLLVEDDPDVRTGMEQALQLAGLSVQSFPSVERVMPRLSSRSAGVLVTDVRLPGLSGLDLLSRVTASNIKLPVILITGHGDITMAVEAMRNGAYDFITKPFGSDQLTEVVRRALENRSLRLQVEALQRQLSDQRSIDVKLIGRSSAMESVRRLILDVADTSASVLVVGETGTGKELVARCLHDHGERRTGNFVALNCGGMPESLFESEVFGHEAGAFTGALKRRIGKIEHANKGTLFLDEIESMPVALQVKILRALQEHTVERLGSNNQINTDCRIVAATKDDLKEMSRRGRFREDLFYRLNVVPIRLPPLRERREDIPLLFEHFVLEAALRYGRDAPIITGSQMRELLAYNWPGNVRELHNIASRFVLGFEIGHSIGPGRYSGAAVTLSDQVSHFERCLIEEELRKQNGSVSETSIALGLPKKTLYDKIHRHQLAIEDYSQ